MKQSKTQTPEKIRIPRKKAYMALPDEVICGPTVVVVPVPISQGGSLRGVLEYLVTTRRNPVGDWSIIIKQFDQADTATVIRLPDAVCKTIFRHKDTAIAKCRTAAGHKAAATRQAKPKPAPAVPNAPEKTA